MLNSWEIFLPEEKRVPAIIEQKAALFKRGASVLENTLGNTDYVIGDQFSATDIIVSYAANLGRGVGFIENMPNLDAYLDRMYAREHYTLSQPN